MKGVARRQMARGGCLTKLVIFLVFAGAVTALAWMLFLPLVFTRELRRRTGFDASVASFALNPISGRIVVRSLTITNPPTFPVQDGLRLTTFEANPQLSSSFRGTLIVDELTLEVAKATLVKRADGQTNWEIFQRNLAGPLPLPPFAKSQIVVRRLRLKFDTLVLADYSERKPRVREYRLGVDQTFTNVSDPKQLLGPSVLHALVASDAAEALGAFLPRDLSRLLSESIPKRSESGLRPGDGREGDAFGGLLEKLEEMRKP